MGTLIYMKETLEIISDDDYDNIEKNGQVIHLDDGNFYVIMPEEDENRI